MKKSLLVIFCITNTLIGFSQQIGIGTTTPNPSAVLDIQSSNKGLLLPRMTVTQINNIPSPAEGLMVYCTDSAYKGIYVYNGTSYYKLSQGSQIPQPAYVGQLREGGVVFYVNPSDPYHGLICSLDDLGLTQWGCPTLATGATGVAIGTGLSNTDSIINACTSTTIAAYLCKNYSVPAYDDWYLPSNNEMMQLYAQRNVVDTVFTNNGGTTMISKAYWTSTQQSTTGAYYKIFSFANPSLQYASKGNTYNVRAIRSF